MIVPGTECCEQHSSKNKQEWPAFSPIKEMFWNLFGVGSQLEYQTPQSNTCESQIGNHVTKMGKAQKTALVSEHVIFLRLRNSWQQESNHSHNCCDTKQQHHAGSS